MDTKEDLLVLKPTGWLTNSVNVAERVSWRCTNRSEPREEWHVHLKGLHGWNAKEVERYPDELINQILLGVRDELVARGALEKGGRGVYSLHDDTPHVDEPDVIFHIDETDKTTYDANTGLPLDPVLVAEAKLSELQEVYKFKVYVKRPITECWERTGKKPYKVLWTILNKGDEKNPEIRARLVVCQYKFLDPYREDTHSATPPYECLRIVISLCYTEDYEEDKHEPDVIVVLDVKRAHFHSKARRDDLYTELCPEDAEPGMCALLLQSMYGTQDASACFYDFYSGVFIDKCGLTRGKGCPCLFFQQKTKVKAYAHGDDFVLGGKRKAAMALAEEIGKYMELKVKAVLGFQEGDDKEVLILNRILRVKIEEDGTKVAELEADPRHAEIVVESLGLVKAKPLSTPGTKEKLPGVEVALNPQESTLARSGIMRCSFLSEDRPELKYPVKELARDMQKPTNHTLQKLKRVGRYLLGAPRLIQRFPWQLPTTKLKIKTDSDHAGCLRTRKSTSAGAA